MSVLSPEDPDYELELFWSTYKCSLENFYNNHKKFITYTKTYINLQT